MAMVARSDDAQRYTMATLLLGFCAVVLLQGSVTAGSHGGMFQRQSRPARASLAPVVAPSQAVPQRDVEVVRGQGEPENTHRAGQLAGLDFDGTAALGGRIDTAAESAPIAAPAKPVLAELKFRPRYANDALIADQVLSWSRARSLNPLLVWLVIDTESTGNPWAVSGEGALGLMQVMPFHFRPGDDPFDIATNVKRGTGVLASYLAEMGSAKLALAAYNAGPAAVREYGGVPPYAETQRFLAKTFDRYVRLLDLAVAAGVDPFSLRYADLS